MAKIQVSIHIMITVGLQFYFFFFDIIKQVSLVPFLNTQIIHILAIIHLKLMIIFGRVVIILAIAPGFVLYYILFTLPLTGININFTDFFHTVRRIYIAGK